MVREKIERLSYDAYLIRLPNKRVLFGLCVVASIPPVSGLRPYEFPERRSSAICGSR
jgi:hypothetical protein